MTNTETPSSPEAIRTLARALSVRGAKMTKEEERQEYVVGLVNEINSVLSGGKTWRKHKPL